MLYNKVDTNMDFVKREKEVEKLGSIGLSKPPIPFSLVAKETEKIVVTATAHPIKKAQTETKTILFFLDDFILSNTFFTFPNTLYPIILLEILNQILQ